MNSEPTQVPRPESQAGSDAPAVAPDAAANVTADTSAARQLTALQFHGSGGEYFRIWIVNLVLTVLTLGIYSAWAKVRSKRYFYGNTRLDGTAFVYHATPMMILKGRLIAVGFLAITIIAGNFSLIAGLIFGALTLLLMPWIIRRSIAFNANMSSYRNVRFSFGGGAGKLYLYLLLLPATALTLLFGSLFWIVYMVTQQNPNFDGISFASVFGLATGSLAVVLLLPYWQKLLHAYYYNHHHFGRARFAAELATRQYFKIYFLMFAGTVGLGVVVGILSVVIHLSFSVGAAELIITAFSYILIGTWVRSYLQTRLRNYAFSQLQLGPSISPRSFMDVGRLFKIYIGNFALLICTLGFAYPWTRVRLARYFVTTAGVWCQPQALNTFIAAQQSRESALGDELGEAFDMDLNLGW